MSRCTQPVISDSYSDVIVPLLSVCAATVDSRFRVSGDVVIPCQQNIVVDKYSRTCFFFHFSLCTISVAGSICDNIRNIGQLGDARLVYNERGRNKEICVHYPRAEGDTPSPAPS